jgi:hypothetical protein
MQEAIILINGALTTGEQTLVTEPSGSSSNAMADLENGGSSSHARLPKLEVRKFDGKIHEWQEFWDNFKSAIHNNTRLSDVDKFSYLRGLIEGPAKATIAGFSLTAENYAAAVELLERRFGKKVAIERAHVSQLLKVSPVYGEKDVRGLRILHDTVETHYRGLCALKVDENTYSGIVVPTLLEKIPDSVRLTITRGEEYLKWTIKELLQALLTEVELREDYRLTLQVKPPAGNGRKMYNASALQVNRDSSRDKDRCAFCMGKHRHEDCARVKDMRERRNLIRKFARCYKCLEKGHCARDCKVVVHCKNCKGGHHSALCETEVSSASQEEGAQVGNEASTHIVNVPASMLVGGSSRIALQTAQALIKDSNSSNRVRVMFDSGSHKSFVTADVARAHNLKLLRKEWLSISTFGRKTTESGLRDVVLIDLIPVSGGGNLTLEAYVVPEISRISNKHVEVVKKTFRICVTFGFQTYAGPKRSLKLIC